MPPMSVAGRSVAGRSVAGRGHGADRSEAERVRCRGTLSAPTALIGFPTADSSRFAPVRTVPPFPLRSFPLRSSGALDPSLSYKGY